MTLSETISRDSRSYRQGLVLGLTMAEIFLLLVFALLIALAALWNAEKNKLKHDSASAVSAADMRLLGEVKAAIAVAGREKIGKALDHLKEGHVFEFLSPPEKEFVGEVRRQQKDAAPKEISDQWRTLTRAVQPLDKLQERVRAREAVEKATPGVQDVAWIIWLIERGLLSEKNGDHDWPPIIDLSEAKGYTFERGRAELTASFETHLQTVVVLHLLDLARRYGVTTIEVIGHTDEQKIAQRTSNLDWFLLNVVNNAGEVSALIPADNAGLGLARAAAVVRILKSDERMKDYTILPLSAAS
jgi:outer membrane protein OmpA-like peptidoglycan-associated protein